MFHPLIKIFLIYLSERPGLVETRKVEKIQEIYLETLQAYVMDNRIRATTEFAKLLSVLPELETLSNLNSKMCFSLKSKNKTLRICVKKNWKTHFCYFLFLKWGEIRTEINFIEGLCVFSLHFAVFSHIRRIVHWPKMSHSIRLISVKPSIKIKTHNLILKIVISNIIWNILYLALQQSVFRIYFLLLPWKCPTQMNIVKHEALYTF